MEDYICCPKCHSRQIHSEKKGYSVGKALAGVWAFGGIGLLAGNIGRQDIIMTCLRCGHKFKPGEAHVEFETREKSNYTHSFVSSSDIIDRTQREIEENISKRKAIEAVDFNNLDPLFLEIAHTVVKEQKASPAFLCRKFQIGYMRCNAIMNQLEKVGVVGPVFGSISRDILITCEDNLKRLLINKGIICPNENEDDSNSVLKKATTEALLLKAANLVVLSNNASISFLQRRLSIGYNKANELLEQLEEVGIVGCELGVRSRDVLLTDVNLIEKIIKKENK